MLPLKVTPHKTASMPRIVDTSLIDFGVDRFLAGVGKTPTDPQRLTASESMHQDGRDRLRGGFNVTISSEDRDARKPEVAAAARQPGAPRARPRRSSRAEPVGNGQDRLAITEGGRCSCGVSGRGVPGQDRREARAHFPCQLLAHPRAAVGCAGAHQPGGVTAPRGQGPHSGTAVDSVSGHRQIAEHHPGEHRSREASDRLARRG